MIFEKSITSFSSKNITPYTQNTDTAGIKNILKKESITFQDFLYLLSPGAETLLPEIAYQAQKKTIQRFGKKISFYAPLYLSNECENQCAYCGFNKQKKVNRITLTPDEIEKELLALKKAGFDSVLLLTGEAPDLIGVDYIKAAIIQAKKHFSFVCLEIFPLSVEDYSTLVKAGADCLTIYQETYDQKVYDKMHIAGKKKDYSWRLNTPGRALEAGFRKIGLGALLGLANWQYEAAMLALHIDFLRKKYWKSEFTLSFPRINPTENSFKIPDLVNNKNLVQMMCAFRLLFDEVGLILSTRENPNLRDQLIGLCTTQISAGSKTNPGGYSKNNDAAQQFDISDNRSLYEMINTIKNKGYDPVIKDWEKNFTGVTK